MLKIVKHIIMHPMNKYSILFQQLHGDVLFCLLNLSSLYHYGYGVNQWVRWQCFFLPKKIGIAQFSQRKDESPVNVGCSATNGSQQIELEGVWKTLP